MPTSISQSGLWPLDQLIQFLNFLFQIWEKILSRLCRCRAAKVEEIRKVNVSLNRAEPGCLKRRRKVKQQQQRRQQQQQRQEQQQSCHLDTSRSKRQADKRAGQKSISTVFSIIINAALLSFRHA